MSEITLNPVRLYTEDDIYEMNTDNRPLVDIMSNIELINSTVSTFGCYLEAAANPETEPVGGFGINICACIRENNLLFPIDITKSTAEVDYSKYPVVLVVGYDTNTGIYKCLTFSSLYKLNDKFPAFLATSVGNTIKAGLGGQLVDSFFFDQYYSSQSYQDIVVGKIASTTSIIFGGNQVGILGDNFYLAKNRDDSTSGLTTVIRSNQDSNVVFKAIGIDTVGSPYMFSEIQNSFRPEYSQTELPVPVYFTNSSINYNQITGAILDLDLNTKLNEVHFASPLLSPSNAQDVIYKSAGITVESLTNFTNQYLLHSAPYSTALNEVSQLVSSNLVFQFQSSDQLTLAAQFPSVVRSIGTTLNQATGIPSTLIPGLTTQASGAIFGSYGQLGSFIGTITDDPTGITRLSASDEDALAQTSGFTTAKLSEMANSSTLLINSMSDDSNVLANIMFAANGYVILSGDSGVHVLKTPKLDSEIANKLYVDNKVAGISSTVAQVVPLVGTTSSKPISGPLVSDVTTNTDSMTVVAQFTTVGTTDIISNSPVRFVDSSGSDASGLTTVNFLTSVSHPTDTAYNALEGVNKGYLESRVNSIFSGTSTSPYVTIAQIGTNPQVVAGLKEFSAQVQMNSNLYMKSSSATIKTDGAYITVENSDGSSPVKLKSGQTLNTDDDSVLTTKDYVDDKIATIANANATIWAAWVPTESTVGGLLMNSAPDTSSSNFSSYVSIATNPSGNTFNFNQACTLRVVYNGLLDGSDWIVKVQLAKNGSLIATTGAGQTTTTGVVSGYSNLNMDVIVSCVPGDTLKFVLAENYAGKTSGRRKSLTSYGNFMVLN